MVKYFYRIEDNFETKLHACGPCMANEANGTCIHVLSPIILEV